MKPSLRTLHVVYLKKSARCHDPVKTARLFDGSKRAVSAVDVRRAANRTALRGHSSMSRIGRVMRTSVDLRLARDGGSPARSRPERPMFPGGMELGDEEVEAAARVIRSHNVFRYYGVGDGPHEVDDFEHEFAAHFGRSTRSVSTPARPR